MGRSVQLVAGNYRVFQKRAFFVEFYSSWCGACQAYAPKFKAFAKCVNACSISSRQLEPWSSLVQVTVLNCADDKNLPICREHSINAFPTIKVSFRNQSTPFSISNTTARTTAMAFSTRATSTTWTNWRSMWPDWSTPTSSSNDLQNGHPSSTLTSERRLCLFTFGVV